MKEILLFILLLLLFVIIKYIINKLKLQFIKFIKNRLILLVITQVVVNLIRLDNGIFAFVLNNNMYEAGISLIKSGVEIIVVAALMHYGLGLNKNRSNTNIKEVNDLEAEGDGLDFDLDSEADDFKHIKQHIKQLSSKTWQKEDYLILVIGGSAIILNV
jgi:hypothetical protein